MASQCSRRAILAPLLGIIRSRESNLSRQWFLTSHTRANTATNGCMRGTGFHSTDGGRRGRHLPCQTCSNRIRMCRTIYLLFGATSRRAGSGCAAAPMSRASCLPQARGLEQWWKHQSLDSSFRLTEFSLHVCIGKPASSEAEPAGKLEAARTEPRHHGQWRTEIRVRRSCPHAVVHPRIRLLSCSWKCS